MEDASGVAVQVSSSSRRRLPHQTQAVLSARGGPTTRNKISAATATATITTTAPTTTTDANGLVPSSLSPSSSVSSSASTSSTKDTKPSTPNGPATNTNGPLISNNGPPPSSPVTSTAPSSTAAVSTVPSVSSAPTSTPSAPVPAVSMPAPASIDPATTSSCASANATSALLVKAPPLKEWHEDWSEFFGYLKEYMDHSNSKIVVQNTDSIKKRNQQLAKMVPARTGQKVDLLPEALGPWRRTMICTHGWKFRSRGTGKRPSRTMRTTNCPFKFMIELGNYGAAWKLRVKCPYLWHNHPLSHDFLDNIAATTASANASATPGANGATTTGVAQQVAGDAMTAMPGANGQSFVSLHDPTFASSASAASAAASSSTCSSAPSSPARASRKRSREDPSDPDVLLQTQSQAMLDYNAAQQLQVPLQTGAVAPVALSPSQLQPSPQAQQQSPPPPQPRFEQQPALQDLKSASSSAVPMPTVVVTRRNPKVVTKRNVGFVFEERCMWHMPWSIQYSPLVQPFRHWENVETKRRFQGLLLVSGLMERLFMIPGQYATIEQLLTFHTQRYVQEIQSKSLREEGGNAGEEAPFAQFAFEIACLSAGNAIAAVDAVMNKQVTMAYVLNRPPGHHATADRGMGFCIFNNVVIATKHLLKKYPQEIKRIAIVDYDVHHGNGTQQAFYEQDNVLYISIHQANNYPANSGQVYEIGVAKGIRTTINVPLPPGSGYGAYEYTFQKLVMPALSQFQPDFIMVSSGFDACYADPLAAMILSSRAYRFMATQLVQAAETRSQGRLVFCHEGGYSESYVPFCGTAVIESLLGIDEDDEQVQDPFLSEAERWEYQSLQIHQKQIIDQAVHLHQPYQHTL